MGKFFRKYFAFPLHRVICKIQKMLSCCCSGDDDVRKRWEENRLKMRLSDASES